RRVPAERRYPTRRGGCAQARAREKQTTLKGGVKVAGAVVMRSLPHRMGNHPIASSFYLEPSVRRAGNNERNRSNEEYAFDQYGCAIGGSCLGVSPKHARRRR